MHEISLNLRNFQTIGIIKIENIPYGIFDIHVVRLRYTVILKSHDNTQGYTNRSSKYQYSNV